MGRLAVSVQVTLPKAAAMLSLVVLFRAVAQLGAEVLVSAALPTATIVHVAALSTVVEPTVVAQVGAVGVPELPATVHRWVLPLESTIRLPELYECDAAHAGRVIEVAVSTLPLLS